MMCAQIKILLENPALLWLTNQNIGLKKLCLCSCKQSSCHTPRLITANTTQKKDKKKPTRTICLLLHETFDIDFTWANPAATESSSPSSAETKLKLQGEEIYRVVIFHKASKHLSQNQMKVRPKRHQLVQKATQDQILLLAFLR